jgi:hypothetical protein
MREKERLRGKESALFFLFIYPLSSLSVTRVYYTKGFGSQRCLRQVYITRERADSIRSVVIVKLFLFILFSLLLLLLHPSPLRSVGRGKRRLPAAPGMRRSSVPATPISTPQPIEKRGEGYSSSANVPQSLPAAARRSDPAPLTLISPLQKPIFEDAGGDGDAEMDGGQRSAQAVTVAVRVRPHNER